ncbi:MAG: L,D-transpeptidase [Phycisphaerae bacterium]|nr:L,D-transpeptidase [Phycisphaerae bacterium]
MILIAAYLAALLGTSASCRRRPAQVPAGPPPPPPQADTVLDAVRAHGWEAYVGQGTGLWVRVDTQQLLVVQAGRVARTYTCSTAANGTGSQWGSEKTPLGWHEIGAKIGDTLPAGAVLEERRWKGRIWQDTDTSDEDLVVSRVLWLKGLQRGHNLGGKVDSWDRYIYIHGTNHVAELGRPTSHGCVRMSPTDVVELFDSVSVGCRVLITE